MADDERPSGNREEGERNLSAGFLPYGDDRQWIRMPRKLPRPRRRRHAPSYARIAVPVLLVICLAAADRVGVFDGASPEPVASTSPRPTQGVIALTGLAATRIGFDRVTIAWDDPDPGEGFTYTIYRDGEPYATSSETTYTDGTVEPKTFHYYAVTANGDLGTVAGSQQLLVAIPTKTGQLPTGSPPPPPPPPIPSSTPSPIPSPSPTPSPSPSPSPTTPSPTPTSSPTPSPTKSPSPSPTKTPTPTSSPSPTPTTSPTPKPSHTPSFTIPGA